MKTGASHNPLWEAFQEQVAIKYQLYNGLFVTLPFAGLADVGVELPVFSELCRKGLLDGKSPNEIVQDFFKNIAHTADFDKQIKILFLLLQFVERQIVLFDALEDAAFKKTHDVNGAGTLSYLIKELTSAHKIEKAYKLLLNYHVRIVLTAHPTQFYPFQVLGVIQDLAHAIHTNNLKNINDLLLQLGKTSFKNTKSPTPLDEAGILIYYLEHIFYPVMQCLQNELQTTFNPHELPPIFELGFWPGGDRDGNPNVTAQITLQVASKLKQSIIDLYIQEIDKLKRRLTFDDMWNKLEKIKHRLQDGDYSNCQQFMQDLTELKQQLIHEDNGLFVDKVENVLTTVKLFGFYFANIDIRQNSHIHTEVIAKIIERSDYSDLSSSDKTQLLIDLIQAPKIENHDQSPIVKDVLDSLHAMRSIQQTNGENACNRYIISNTQGVHNILEVMLLAHWADCKSLDILPLFETITDLENSESIMQALYNLPLYRTHLKQRNNKQTVMLGFSDGTKDGGYVTANWAIFKCKKNLYNLSEKMGIEIIFFDGRGGPPARGGGNTHKFYRAMEGIIQQKQIQLTIQGQTVSSNFGTEASARYNLEQLFTSGLLGPLFGDQENILTNAEYSLLDKLSTIAYECYIKFKNHPLFTRYLEKITPLLFYAELNITSRPVRRSTDSALRFEDLRAIPFVGSWSQIKQNVPGYYGLGTALKILIDQGKEAVLKELYQHSLYFRTLLENAMQSLLKCNFLLTQNLKSDPEFGDFWSLLFDEAELSIQTVKQISGQCELLENDPINRQSILMRENLVLPLLIIQQYAQTELAKMDAAGVDHNAKKYQTFRKLILKSLAANINASRNAA